MSYCRFIESDVYMYLDVHGGITCCGCSLQQRVPVEDPKSFLGWYLRPIGPIVKTRRLHTDEAIEHLKLHIEAGGRVPDRVIPEIESDREEIEASFEDQSV